MISFRKMATNFSFLVAGEISSKAFTFVAFMYLARTLEPVYYGHLEFTIAVMVFFTLFTDLGTSPWGAREIAREPERLNEILSGVFWTRVVTAAAGFTLVFVFSQIFTNGVLRKLLLIYALSLLVIPMLLQWVFQGTQQMKTVAWASITKQSSFCILIFLLIRNKNDLVKIGWIECASAIAIMTSFLLLFRKRFGLFKPVWNFHFLKQALSQSYPIGLSEMSWAWIWYSATVMLGLLIGGNAVGFYGAAHRPVMAIHTFVWLHFYNLLPSIAQSMQESGIESLRSLLNRSLTMASWTAFLMGSMATVLARPLILFIYGPQYASSVAIFQILIWVVSALLISGHFSYALIGWNLQRFHMLSFFVATIMSLLLSFILIPRYEMTGAAFAVFGGILTKGVLAWFFVNRKIGSVPVLRYLWRPALPALLSLAAYRFLPQGDEIFGAIGVFILFLLGLWILQPNLVSKLRTAWKQPDHA
jgi:O-antigen/teichoic acid export membrane protein